MQNPEWFKTALQALHVQEGRGDLNNEQVLQFFRDVGHNRIKSDEVAWCAAYVGACLERVGIHSTRSLMARSYLKWGEKIDKAKTGAVAVFSRGRNPHLGHVGFVVEETPNQLMILGGNQQNQVNISPYPKSRLLGLRWPTPGSRKQKAGQSRNPDAGFSTEKHLLRSKYFRAALSHILKYEGGWADDPSDPGGATNKGITIKTYAAFKGMEINQHTRQKLKRALLFIPNNEVEEIYYTRYWQKGNCHELPAGVALMHFDCAVNQGPGRAMRFLQKSVGSDVDGEFGPRTKAASWGGKPEKIIDTYRDLRKAHYQSLPHFTRFGRGWLRRLAATHLEAQHWANANTNSEQETIPDYSQTNKETEKMDSNEKWWAESLTIWGAIVTALSTVLPVLGPLVGLDLTQDMIQHLGEQVAQMIQAIGGVLGTLMTIYGRVRAEQKLTRRPFGFNF